MTLNTCLIGVIFVLCINESSECLQKTTSCNDVNTAEGFTFLHECPEGSEISVFANRTLVACAVLGTQTRKYLDEVKSIGNHSVVTRNCRDLQVKCIVPLQEDVIDEICFDYKVTAMPNPDSFHSPTPRNLIIGGAVGVFGLGVLMVLIALCYWKKNPAVVAIVSWFSRFLRCSCLRNEISQEENNGVIRLSEISATDPCGSGGSGGSDVEQDNTLASVHVHSIDPTADGEAPQSFSLDRNSSKQGIQPTESGDVIVSDGNGASDHRSVNRDDAGGVNDDNGKAIVGIGVLHSGWTVGDRGPEDHGNEGQPLLSTQRAANQGFDMTGQAGALVYKHGFDPDQVSRCSTVPDTDVESTPNINN